MVPQHGTVLRMGRKLLIAAGEAATSTDDIPPAIRALIDQAAEIRVIAPRLPGLLQWISSDTDKATEHADERLVTVLGHLDEMGASSSGEVADDDPLLAFEDAIRDFAPDHIVVALRPENRTGWQEHRLLDRIEERFAIPMTVFQLPST
jgi:hypothetical protein